MREYELVAIISPEITEDELPQAMEKLGQLIERQGGKVLSLEQWGRRKFAYPIKHYGEGNYVVTRFELEPEKAAELESNLKLSEEILRHLLVKVDNRT
ncbi:MAG: 30S ribosomal protein S6 [Chloroflexi bacterium]|nr:MAG: 30S ribosomal protein S6 [Chloroflexota bacterium]